MNPTREAGQSDADLVARIRGGARDAFRVLIERHQDRVYNLLVRLVGQPETARDLGQETFLKAYLSLDQYKSEFKFTNWVLKIAQNLAFSHLRRAGVSRERLTLDGPDAAGPEAIPDPSPGSDPQRSLEEKTVGQLALKAISELSEKYRLVLVLRHTEGRSYQEIAEILTLPLGTVKFRLHQATKMLAEKFRVYGVIER